MLHSGKNLNLVLCWACTVITVGTVTTLLVLESSICRRRRRRVMYLCFFNGGDEFPIVEDGLVDTAVTAFA